MDGKLLDRLGIELEQEAAGVGSRNISPNAKHDSRGKQCFPYLCVMAEEIITAPAPDLDWPFWRPLNLVIITKGLYNKNGNVSIPWEGVYFCQQFLFFVKTDKSTSLLNLVVHPSTATSQMFSLLSLLCVSQDRVGQPALP